MQVAQFIHGNRLEALADRLIDDLRDEGSADPMRPHIVVVAHPALGRWLQERIAARCGIAANVQFPLPSTFAWDVLRACDAGLSGSSAFSRAALCWRIYALLPRLSRQPHFESVANYLGDGSDPRLRYDLALALARVFDEYMVARPRWLLAWKRGTTVLDDADEVWQAELWRALVSGTDEPDRTSLMQGVLERLASLAELPRGVPEKARIFGASFLPPLLLEFFLDLAGRIQLDFYQPNPCLDYWGDVVSERELARRKNLWNRHGRRDVSEYHEVGHPLLASWGVLGREYLKAIHAPDVVLHDEEAFVLPAAAHLLGWLQRGLLLLDPGHAPAPTAPGDASIRIHGCPNRLREVEVLRDQLLLQFERLDDLKPHEIVVLSPRLEEYIAYIDAVFGDAEDPLAIPYSIGDVPLRRSHPLLDAFSRLLAIGDSRFTASEILGLISEPSIARRHALDDDALEWIRTWVRESGIRWGLDDQFRAEVGAAALNQNSWRFGLDRLLLGYAQGDALDMIGGEVPEPNVEGGAAQALGQLARFVAELDRTRRGQAVARSAALWKRWLNGRVDAMFDTESGDSAEIAALGQLREVIAALDDTAGQWLNEEALPFEVVREALGEALDEPRAARGSRFGIRFRSMVPMRNVPHRVVCLLGLNAGEFPRRQPAEGFHLMRRHAQAGDRNVREDDRFLFLECVVAARDALHLSFVDRDARAGTPSPPSALVEELAGFLRQHDAGEVADDGTRPRIREHATQPFDAQCFEPGHVQQSYDTRWLDAARALAAGWRPARPFAELPAAMPATDPADEPIADTVELEAVMSWLRHPAKAYFRHALPLRPPDHESLDDTEPFHVDGLTRYQLVARLLGDPGSRPTLDRAQGEGIFPLGPLGEEAWQGLDECAAELDALTVRCVGNLAPVRAAESHSVAVGDDGTRLSGTPRLLFEGHDGSRVLLVRRPGEIRGIDLARLALERELLAANGAVLPAYAIGWKDKTASCHELAPLEDAAGWMSRLLSIYREGLRRPLPLYRKAAECYAEAMARKNGRKPPLEAARDEWETDEFDGCRDAYNALVSRHCEEPLDEEFCRLSESVYLPLYLARTKLNA